eukprot:183344-Rhodomonas_salina.1
MEAVCDKLIEKGADINAKSVHPNPSVGFMHASAGKHPRPLLVVDFAGFVLLCVPQQRIGL